MPRVSAADFRASPNPLARHYTRFRVAERLLLTGHSHQAWPDCGYEAQQQAWLDAAQYVDDKWEHAFAQADQVRKGYARLLDDTEGHIALGENTHDLIVRFLSALPLRTRPRLVTTDGEFYTVRRLLTRIAEEGIEVVRVQRDPVDALAERVASTVNDQTSAVLVSSVLYSDARIVPGLKRVQQACDRHGAELLIDAYHQLNVVPFSLRKEGLTRAYVTGAGYKYCQLGEGNGFLRLPPDCALRPITTGWFSEFATMTAPKRPDEVAYGEGPARFAGATYDPTSNYRAARVFDFFERQGLTPDLLREVSRSQIRLLAERFDAGDLDPAVIARDRNVNLNGVGGFLALKAPRAVELVSRLKARGVFADARGDVLRLGPAPYLSDQQIEQAVGILAEEAVRS